MWIGVATVFILALMAGQLRLSHISDSASPLEFSDEWVSSDWVCSKTWPEDSRPLYATAENSWSALCDQGLDQVRVFIADYPFQEQGREAIHFDNDPIPNAERTSRGVSEAKLGQGSTDLLFRPVESRLGQLTQLTWVAYRVAGSPVSGTLDAKFAQLDGILDGRWDAQVYVLSATCKADCSNANIALQRFARDNSRELLGDRRSD